MDTMTKWPLSFTLLIYMILYTFFFPIHCQADTGVNEHIHHSIEDVDLISFVKARSQGDDDLFTQAIDLIESINSSPSCNRIAAKKLVTSCKSMGRKLDPSESNTPLDLDHVRSLYAARLAVCELRGAGAPVSSDCHDVNALPSQKGFSRFFSNQNLELSDDNPAVKKALQSCLKSLESRPQSWISYSNSRQNAVIICQAHRAENEREEIFELYDTMFKISIKLSHGLHESLRAAAEESSSHRAFIQSNELLMRETAREIETSTSSLRNKFDDLTQILETYFGSSMETFASAFGGLHTGLNILQNDVRDTSREVDNLRHSVQAVHNETLLRSEQMASTTEQNAIAHHELALSLQSRLQLIGQNEIVELMKGLRTFDASLALLDGKLLQIAHQGNGMSEHFHNLESRVDELQFKVARNLETQEQQQFMAAVISQEQQHQQENLRISKAFIEQTASAAANLKATIDETAAIHKESGIARGIFGPYLDQVKPALYFLGFLGFLTIISLGLFIRYCFKLVR
ncbi:hypothetical protein BJX99DRAFT_41406 [Aspergillus californicus]